MVLSRLRQFVMQDVDLASLAAFRVLMGLLLLVSTLRFILNGWIERFYLAPEHHFHYWMLSFVDVPSATVLYGLFAVMVAASVGILVGWWYRASVIAFLVAFTWVELIDVSYYLNHYYLVSLLLVLMAFLPLDQMWSLRAWRSGQASTNRIPRLAVWLLRGQVGLVYFYAGIAKLNEDWLLAAQPLNIWLTSRTELVPFVGSWLDVWWVALAMSWGGFLHDILMAPALCWERTRRYAYAILVVFHAVTGLLFNIGMFPLIMIIAATVCLSPVWPRRWLGWFRRPGAAPVDEGLAALAQRPSQRLVSWAMVAVVLWLGVQLVLPLRSLVYEGPVAWHEQGMRWSWKVMVREKNGSVSYRVEDTVTGRSRYVQPSCYLTSFQEREMSGQPDLILQLAHHIGDQKRAEWGHPVKVYADVVVSWNGRSPARLIDPEVDLMTVQDGLSPQPWILPAPQQPPPRLRGTSHYIASH